MASQTKSFRGTESDIRGMRVGAKLEFGLKFCPPDLKLFTPNAMCSSPCLPNRSILSRTTAIFAHTWARTDSFIHELLSDYP